VEELREELYEYIEKYGFLDPRTIKKSQELDKLVVSEQTKKSS
jgi:hypothetical protein